MISRIDCKQSFQSRQRILSPKSFKNLSDILYKMNSEAEVNFNQYIFNSTITKELRSVKDETRFLDGRLFLHKVDDDMQNLSTSTIKLGKEGNISVVIDNETGRLAKIKKPFFKSFSKIMKKIDEVLETFNLSFNNEKIVSKNRITIEGFRENGVTYLRELEKSSKK